MTQLPKYMLCYKNGKVIKRAIQRFETSQEHMELGIPGPMQSIPYLEPGEMMIYDTEGKVHILGSWDDRKIFIDGGK